MARRFNTELFISRRISSPQGGRKNVMVRIAAITVAVSMAVMIVAMAVITGFKKEVTDKLVGVGAHVTIVNLDGNNSFETSPIHENEAIAEAIKQIPDFKSISRYAIKGGIIRTPEAFHGTALKGIGPDYDLSFLASSLLEGSLPEVADTTRKKDLLVSAGVARMLSLSADDRVEVLFVGSSGPIRRDRFKVCGIYSTGMEELDNVMAFTDIRNVQRLNGWASDQITGCEVMTKDFGRLSMFSDEVFEAVFNNTGSMSEMLKVEDVVSQNPNTFDWLKAHDMNAAVIITIMLLVAFLNMISAMLIILLEKTSMIGILKALGMSNWNVQKIFLYRSLRIVLSGMLYGNIIGIAVCLIQKYTGLVKLDSAGYMLSEVPITLSLDWLLWLNVGVPVVLVLLLIIPSMIVTKIKPDRTIRYQ